MRCRQVQKILSKANWNPESNGKDSEFSRHLESCLRCSALVRAELDLRNGIGIFGKIEPERKLSLESLKLKVEQSGSIAPEQSRHNSAHIIRKAAISFVVIAFITLTLIPFNFRDKVGYGISISGVDANIAMESKGVVPLLGALGMENEKAMDLMNSLEKKEVHLKVGECTETCHLKISDLKTEKDVQLIIRAIIELGCCEIDDVFPIFHDESSSLLGRATKKLFS